MLSRDYWPMLPESLAPCVRSYANDSGQGSQRNFYLKTAQDGLVC